MLTSEALSAFPLPVHQPWRDGQDVRMEPGFTAFRQWLPTESEPGLIVAQRWPGEPKLLTHSRSHFSRLEQIRDLGQAGLSPALEATGLHLYAKTVHDATQRVDTTVLALTTPPTAYFCDQATAFLARTHPADHPEGPLTFKPYGSNATPHFTPYELTAALAERTILVSRDGDTGVHDMLDHSIGWLGLPPSIIDYPQRQAQQLLARAENAAETPEMQELTFALEFGITTHLLHQVIRRNEEYGLWADLLGQPDAPTLQAYLDDTRQHIDATAHRTNAGTT